MTLMVCSDCIGALHIRIWIVIMEREICWKNFVCPTGVLFVCIVFDESDEYPPLSPTLLGDCEKH